MSRRTLTMTDALVDYLYAVSPHEHDVLRRLREATAMRADANMQIGPEQGRFMGWLVATLGARRIVEVGVFTGYSSLAMALALPADGTLVAIDRDPETGAIAREHWRLAGVDAKIEQRFGDALAELDRLLADGKTGAFDFAFIDADKARYLDYYERALRLLRPGGVVAVDNVLWDGKVADPAARDADTEAIRAFNRRLADDTRVDLSLLPVADGLTLARKR